MILYDVVIVGGGLAGLSAAVDLSCRGKRVLVLEQRRHAGGRAWSYHDSGWDEPIDNGQHVMMGCYHATRNYLRTIGAEGLASLQPTLRIPFLRPGYPLALLRCPPLVAPFHVAAGLMRLSSITLPDRVRLLRVGFDLCYLSPSKEKRLSTMSVEEWLISLGQSIEARRYLWDVIAIGSLNDAPSVVSALLFFRVLRTAFFGKRQNASLLLSRVGLSELLVDPAVDFITRHGGMVQTEAGVARFVYTGGRVDAVELENGERILSESYVAAVPWYAFPALLGNDEPSHQFAVSPIITIYLRFDRRIMETEFAALLDSRMQWVFNRTGHASSAGEGGQTVAVLVSGAAELIHAGKDELVRIAREDLAAVIPAVRKAELLRSLVLKEKRATFSPRPQTELLRPGTRTEFRNLFLAGDWTDTGFPATIEGAIVSGQRAAQALLAS